MSSFLCKKLTEIYWFNFASRCWVNWILFFFLFFVGISFIYLMKFMINFQLIQWFVFLINLSILKLFSDNRSSLRDGLASLSTVLLPCIMKNLSIFCIFFICLLILLTNLNFLFTIHNRRIIIVTFDNYSWNINIRSKCYLIKLIKRKTLILLFYT